MSSRNRWHKDMYNEAYAKISIGSPQYLNLAVQQVNFLEHALKLKPAASILDIPCGVGRHAVLLAKKGHTVTGVDISRDCLKIARKQHSSRNLRYQLGDMWDLSRFRGSFDVVLNLFTSFGYFHTDAENEAVLNEMYRALKPGGQAVVNLVDRDWLLKVYQPARWSEHNGLLTMETSCYDKRTKYNESHLVMIRGRRLLHRQYHRVRLYSKPEMTTLLKKVGFRKLQVYGDFEGHAFKKGHSTHPIYLASRPD